MHHKQHEDDENDNLPLPWSEVFVLLYSFLQLLLPRLLLFIGVILLVTLLLMLWLR